MNQRNSPLGTSGGTLEAPTTGTVAAVIAAIEKDIIRGRILPTSRLIEDHLMEDYGAKRHAVRAALLELQRLGVVVKPPHLGASLHRFDLARLDALYHLRAVLHRSAIELFSLPLDASAFADLCRTRDDHAAAAAEGDLVAIHKTNMAFHRAFYGLCRNPYLAESIRLHDWLSFPARAYGIADQGALRQACDEHAEMVRIAQCGDRGPLIDLALAHMQRARDIYVAKFLAA